MKVSIVGAGPVGLYLAILLKKADPSADVEVLERNAPDATFGFGVVFSEETLGSLRDADPETHLAITDTFVRWNRVDIRYRDPVLRSRGHSFSAIARKRLLELLQERCRALGVELRFGVDRSAASWRSSRRRGSRSAAGWRSRVCSPTPGALSAPRAGALPVGCAARSSHSAPSEVRGGSPANLEDHSGDRC